MSMELPESFRDCILHGDQTSLFYVAHALMQVQVLYGIIPRIVGKGDMAAVGLWGGRGFPRAVYQTLINPPFPRHMCTAGGANDDPHAQGAGHRVPGQPAD